jgi:WbqC-like protein family
MRAIEFNYRRAIAFANVAPWLFEQLQAAAATPSLSELNERLIRAVAQRLAFTTPIRRRTTLLDRGAMVAMDATERLVALCAAAGVDRCLSGPAAKGYLDVAAFTAKGITVEWMDYPDYPQLWGAFEPRLSIIDLPAQYRQGRSELSRRQTDHMTAEAAEVVTHLAPIQRCL